MEYALLIYNSEADGKKMSAAQQGEMFQGYHTFTQDLTKSGKNKGGNALEQTTTATTVRVRNGKTVVTDGPFAETKEQLLGFFIVECASLEQAIDTAKELGRASSTSGSYEIRPLRALRPGALRA